MALPSDSFWRAVLYCLHPRLFALSILPVVTMFMTPSMTALVGIKRFLRLAREHGGCLAGSIVRSLGLSLLATIALVATVHLLLMPPLVLVVPLLIWGWLTYRVMFHDVLANHASREERDEIFRAKRLPLLCTGELCGYFNTAPSLLWASGAILIAMAPVLVPLAIWIYALVFFLSSLWFRHDCLAAPPQVRQQKSAFAENLPAPSAIHSIADCVSRSSVHLASLTTGAFVLSLVRLRVHE